MSEKIVRTKFNSHGLGDCVQFAYLLQLYKARGYDIRVQIECNKRFVWEVAGVTIDPGNDYQHHAWGYPWQFDRLNEPDCVANKTGHNLHAPSDGMPDIGTREELWPELCQVRLSAHDKIPPEAHAEVEEFLEGLPRPIICLHSHGTNWTERKSIPIEVDHALILELLQRFNGSVVVLDYDARAAMVCHERVRGIRPYWPRTEIDRLCAIYERADLLIGIDSGPFHVAAFTDIKCLGVFRKLNPNHVCLPNPNAVYLVPSSKHGRWKNLDPHWSIREYAGVEPTAAEIAHEAERILMSAQNDESMQGRYLYKRVGYDEREIELLAGDRIGEGGGDAEQRWYSKGGGSLIISGRHGIICECVRGTDGVFRGRWTQFERMPIELHPIALKPLPKVTVVANWDDEYEAVGAIIRPNRQAYAQLRGYAYAETRHPGSWGKLQAMLDAWDGADWLWWLDADACVTDLEKPLPIPDCPCTDMVITCDRNGINCGSMLVRTCDAMRAIFEEALKRREDFDWPNGLGEQNALMFMLWKVKDRVAVVPQRTMNSYAKECGPLSENWEPGDFVLHAPALPNRKRIEILSEAVRYASNATDHNTRFKRAESE